jgi:hypothetical protein
MMMMMMMEGMVWLYEKSVVEFDDRDGENGGY